MNLLLPRCRYLLTHVDLGEAEGAEVRVGAFHRRLDRLSEQFVHELTDKRPHLFHRLGTDRNIHFSSNYTAQEKHFYPSQGGQATTSDCKEKKTFLNRFRCHSQKMVTGQARAHSDLVMLQMLEGH